MHHFTYRNGALHAEDVSLTTIAEEIGTPVYCYSTATIERHYKLFAAAVGAPRHRIFYAMKANPNLAVLRTLADLGAGADTVSEGEIRKALAAGIPPDRIVFSGVGKTDAELAFAIDSGIYQLNVETEDELVALSRVAAAKGRRQATALRINPDVGAGGHAKITTGSDANKFGVSIAEAERLYVKAANMPGVAMVGLACHIGSQIRELGELEAAFIRLRTLTTGLRAQGLSVQRLDFGGGLGIDYRLDRARSEGPDLIEAYGWLVDQVLGDLDVERGFEPGRLIVGNAGLLLTRVVRTNPRPHTTFLVVDAAMNDLVRPVMYDAYHEIWPVVEPSETFPRRPYDVVGPICESGDTFCAGRELPETRCGDLVALMTAGAYGAAMSSTYNSRLLIAEVIVKGREFAVVRPRQTYEELIGLDQLADWQRRR